MIDDRCFGPAILWWLVAFGIEFRLSLDRSFGKILRWGPKTRAKLLYTSTMWAPPLISWLINLMNYTVIVSYIIIVNHSQ